jgi:hypothetical protein
MTTPDEEFQRIHKQLQEDIVRYERRYRRWTRIFYACVWVAVFAFALFVQSLWKWS